MASCPVLVAVVSWNTRELLDRCLGSLQADAAAGLASVCVVDNDSSDGSADLVSTRHPWARLIRHDQNVGFGRAVNSAARLSDPGWSWIVCANADTAPSPGALAALMEAGAADPGAGVLAPVLVLPDGSVQHSAYPFPTLPLTVAFNTGLHRVVAGLGDRLCLEGHWDAGRPRRVPWSIGAFLLIRGTAWREVGGFDEDQFMYAEDLDLGWRLRRAGWATRHVPSARVLHESAASTSQAWGDERLERWQTETYAWLVRRRGSMTARAVAAVNVAGALLRSRLAREAWRREADLAWMRRHRRGFATAIRSLPPSG